MPKRLKKEQIRNLTSEMNKSKLSCGKQKLENRPFLNNHFH